MIKANELRIGNLVNRHDIGDDHIRIEYILELGNKPITSGPSKVICEYEDLFGITLTEEWLLKFGFNRGGYDYWINNKIHIEIRDYKTGDYSLSINEGEFSEGKQFQYVHKLQNICFALSGEELQLSK